MDETPLSILYKRVKFYHSFMLKLKTKEGMNKDLPQEKYDSLIIKCEEKIKEFESAIKILDPTFKFEDLVDQEESSAILKDEALKLRVLNFVTAAFGLRT